MSKNERKLPKHPMDPYTKRYLWLLTGCAVALLIVVLR